MRRQIPKGIITVGLLVIGLIVFEVFNYHTSRIALDDIFTSFGSFVLGGAQVTLGAMLAMGAATIDIGGILRIFTPEQGKHEPAWVRSAYTFWLLATIINAGLTYWVARLGLVNARRIPPELVNQEVLIALIIAIFVWAIRYGLVRNLATTGDAFFHIHLPEANIARRKKAPPVSKPFFNFPLPSVQRPTPTPISEEEGDGKWDKEQFLKALEQNPRMKKRSQDKLAKMAGVSPRTIYRWMEDL